MEKLPWTKIWLNQESSLTDVWLKWDPTVLVEPTVEQEVGGLEAEL